MENGMQAVKQIPATNLTLQERKKISQSEASCVKIQTQTTLQPYKAYSMVVAHGFTRMDKRSQMESGGSFPSSTDVW